MKLGNRLTPIFITVFIDLLGLGIVVPIAAPLLLNQGEGMLPLNFNFGQRSLVLGFLLGIYSVAQFFGAPFLGALADKYGRKKLLLLSISGTCVAYVLFAIGIMDRSILLCLASRLLDGFTGGNVSIAMSAISDITEEKDRSKNFGLIGISFGLGFILGPFIGGVFADSKLVSWFSFETPYWGASILSFCNLLIIQGLFKETLRHRKKVQLGFLSSFKNIAKAFKMKRLRAIFVALFLIVLGFNFFTQFFQVFLIYKFSFSATDIAYLFAYIGLWLAISQGVINVHLSKRLATNTLVSWSAFLCALTFPFLLLPSKSSWLYLVVPFIALFNGINTPNLIAVISFQGNASEQGSILGMRQSILSLAMAIPPIIAGLITSLNASLPIWSAALFSFAGWGVFRFGFLRKKAMR